MKYVSWKDRKKAAAAMLPIYTALNEAASKPGQASEDTGLAGGKAHVLVVSSRRVEQCPRPRQVAEPASNRGLADHQIGRLRRVEAACDRLLVHAVGGGVVALPGSQRGQAGETEHHKIALPRCAGPLQERFVSR